MKTEKEISSFLKEKYNTTISTATIKQLYNAVGNLIEKTIAEKKRDDDFSRRAVYLSAEFLLGRLDLMNLVNLGLYDSVAKTLSDNGRNIKEFESVPDMALGNGGLGRLAACFLDSAATKSIKLDGYGIRYKYGIFKQKIKNKKQTEHPDEWVEYSNFLSVPNEEDKVTVEFKDQTVVAVPFDTAVIGYGGKTVNNLRLWEARAVNEFDYSLFDNGFYQKATEQKIKAESISYVLYPNDNTTNGKKLRLKQEYFMCSATIQDMIRRLKRNGKDISEFAHFYAVQLNDTHPALAIPELVRLLTNEGVEFDYALNVAKATFCYTNHTVMPEALEKFGVPLFKSVLPNVFEIIMKINSALKKELKEKGIKDLSGFLIVDNGVIHMAKMATFLSRSINGVAKIHTEIVKNSLLKNWYEIYPERFNNKTNGITQRRWLLLSNPELSHFITARIGDNWITNLPLLSSLKDYQTDLSSISEFRIIKQLKKQELSKYILEKSGEKINPEFIFDIQVKRIHEYKRQLLNALSIMDTYLSLKDGTLKNFTPTAYLIGGKSASGYLRAKSIINLILEIKEKIESDSQMKDLIKVSFLENYNVSYAEKIIPAAEVSEQISTAGMEASGTGNMKFMLNGAVTLGTMDGANIEIVEKAGKENNYIFGLDVDGVRKLEGHYNPLEIYEENERIRRVLDTLVDGSLKGDFKDIYDSLLFSNGFEKADKYFVLADFIPYCETRKRLNDDYKDSDLFFKKCLMNTASAGDFSSDETVKKYAREIWKV